MWFLVGWLVDADRFGWAGGTALASCTASLVGSLHVLLRKRPGPAAAAWIALVWLSPVLGTLAYGLFGINRVRRKAERLLRGRRQRRPGRAAGDPFPTALHPYAGLARAVGRITGEPLLAGNRLECLRNGDEAYPAMLEAIALARSSVGLMTYLLDDDVCGRQFVDALVAAHQRGVHVRVLVDGIGARRAGGVLRALRRAGVPTGVFLWSWVPWKMALVNLRNHRKLLMCDGRIGFTGGMNIRQAYVGTDDGLARSRASGSGPRAVASRIVSPGDGRDLHFRVRGPVVRELQEQFVLDWAFCSGEALAGERWFPALQLVGPSLARVIPAGPDEDLDKLGQVLFHAVGTALHSVLVVTPYFLPPPALRAALISAAQRGVRVDVLVPENNEPAFMNRVLVDLAEPLLQAGIRIGLVPGAFEHTKLLVVDDVWVLLGSANWDPRSLRLNFELDLEVYDPALALDCRSRLAPEIGAARWLSIADVRGRSVPRRLGDAVIRLFDPYL